MERIDMMKNFKLLMFFIAVLYANMLFAANGKISGQVINEKTGEPIPGATVIIESTWKNNKEIELSDKPGAACDSDGYYFILNVVPGVYTIKATMMGYKTVKKTHVRVNMDRTITVNFNLEETVLEMDAVQVVARREIIKADVSGTQEIINTDRLHESPVIRMDEFVNNIKGVELVADEDGNGISIRGGDIRETDVRLDGISTRDPRSGNSYLSFNSTSVSEMQVMTGGFEAKYGGFRSGMVNVVTKEGSRDKYTISLKVDYGYGGQKKYFGTNPWSDDSWIYKVYADTGFKYYDPSDDQYYSYAMHGVPSEDSLRHEGLPEELENFQGWISNREGYVNHSVLGFERTTYLTPEQKRQIWMVQHPQYEHYSKPDMYAEGTITGPVPLLKRSTFMLGGKFERTQFAFPIGPRDYYQDINSQLKITSRITDNMKLSINGLYGKVQTNTANRPSSLGGALQDYSSRFSFLNNNQSSVRQQAKILGSQSGFVNMFNKSQLQLLDQQWIMSGIKFNHTISRSTYHTLNIKFSYNDNSIDPLTADTTKSSAWTSVDSLNIVDYPSAGTPLGSTNYGKSIDDMFNVYGGLQQVDSSYSWSVDIRWDLTSQINRYNQLETGFNFRYINSHVYSGTWYQSEKMYTPGIPDTWQYYTVTPMEFAAYIQDKLEFQGMIANIGLRMDYFNPQKHAYQVSHPLDDDFANFYNLFYEYLPGQWGSYERWEVFREELEDPPGWPKKEKKGQLKLSPRMGVSFPITERSKMYFNFGHSYQPPNMSFIYNIAVSGDKAIIPAPDLEMGKTVLYEFGYEQQFLDSYLFNTTLYYKDVKNDPLAREYVNYWQDFTAITYVPDAYADIRGIELRLEKNFGRFFTFWGNYEYILKSWGRSGLSTIYENKVLNADLQRTANISTTEPLPEAHFNVNFHTPRKWKLLGGFSTNFQAEWRDGGEVVMKQDQITGKQYKVEVVDYFNLDLRASKMFRLGNVDAEFVVTVSNLLNQKRLFVGGMSTSQYNKYKESLRFWYEEDKEITDPATGEVVDVIKNHGNDKWGEWDKEYIDIGWFTAPLFLNPRRILIGFRFNF